MPSGVVAAAGAALFATLTAGTNATFTGFLQAQLGALIPSFLNNLEIAGIESGNGPGATTLLIERFGGNDVPDDDATVVTLNITGTFAGGTNPRTVIHTRASASYSGNLGGFSSWQFPVDLDSRMLTTNVYDIEWVL